MYRHAVFLSTMLAVVFGSKSLLDGDVNLMNGVKLVGIPVSNAVEEDTGRSFGEDTILYKMARFLQGHELHVKLPNLVEKEKLGVIFSESLKAVDETYKDSVGTGRGKGGGGASLALLGMMFAKTLGAIGIGGLGLLTMKALALSALALMLAALVGVKKLASHDDHEDHQVIYAGHHGHHRRRRDVPIDTPLPYQGWADYNRSRN